MELANCESEMHPSFVINPVSFTSVVSMYKTWSGSSFRASFISAFSRDRGSPVRPTIKMS